MHSIFSQTAKMLDQQFFLTAVKLCLKLVSREQYLKTYCAASVRPHGEGIESQSKRQLIVGLNLNKDRDGIHVKMYQ